MEYVINYVMNLTFTHFGHVPDFSNLLIGGHVFAFQYCRDILYFQ